MVSFAETGASGSAGDERAARFERLRQLDDEIGELSAHEDALVYQILVRVREFERLEGWGGGFVSCAHWLSWRTGIELGAARERVRVARALEALPRIADALRTAAISYSKARALTRVATAETEGSLLELARHATTAHMERFVRAWRQVDRQDEAARDRVRHQSRSLTLLPNDDGSYELRGRLEPEVAAALQRALEAAAWQLYREARPSAESTVAQRRADALGMVAECALQGQSLARGRAAAPDADAAAATPGKNPVETRAAEPSPHSGAPLPDHRLVILHVDADALRAGTSTSRAWLDDGPARTDALTGNAILDDGTRVSAETSRRIACDAPRVVMTHAPDGTVSGVGRKTRAVPPALRRALDQRDGGCRFPGCCSRFCDAHHVRHWADGGETRLHNLILLCRVHHRAVHEGGFTVEMREGTPRFHTPAGETMGDAPPRARVEGDARERWGSADVDHRRHAQLWSGDPLDVDLALAALRRPHGASGHPAAVAAG